MLTVTITVSTEEVETACRVIGGDYFYIKNTDAFTIDALIVGDDTLIENYSYQFACETINSDQACSLTQAQVADPTFTIGASTLRAETLHKYTITVIDKSFNEYAFCGVYIETAPADEDVIELELIEAENIFGYLDITETHNFECGMRPAGNS